MRRSRSCAAGCLPSSADPRHLGRSSAPSRALVRPSRPRPRHLGASSRLRTLGPPEAGDHRRLRQAPERSARVAPASSDASPLPTTTCGVATTASSTSSSQSGGRPTGVIAPYSMPLMDTASSMGANDALRASSRLRTSPLTSARVVASTTQSRVAGNSSPRTGDDHAIGRDLHSHVVRLAEGRRVREVRIDLRDERLRHPCYDAATGAARRSSRSAAGTRSQLSECGIMCPSKQRNP
jgi:hypothetical protein